MTKHCAAGVLMFAFIVALSALPCRGADTGGNLIQNGGFEAGIQFWNGDGKIILLPNGNRVYEIEASKSRMKDIHQEFHMKQLQQVEILFRARSIDYKGPGIRAAIHMHGSGSVFWVKELPEDGSWKDFQIKYTRTNANVDLRELVIETLLGTGKIQIDDVEVREPGRIGKDDEPPSAATPAPGAKTPAPLAFVRPPPAPALPTPALRAPTPPIAAVPAPTPTQAARQSVPAGVFGSLEQIVNSTPADIRQKLQTDATLNAGEGEMDEYFANNVKGKPAQLHLKIDKANPRTPGENKFLVHVLDHEETTLNGVRLSAWLWVKFSKEDMPPDDKLAEGSEITVSGVITRCEVGRAGRFHLNVDVGQSKLAAP